MPGFASVRLSLGDLLGRPYVDSVRRAHWALFGDNGAADLATEPVDFFPDEFQAWQHAMLEHVGKIKASQAQGELAKGATTRQFEVASHAERAPLSARGAYRIGEDGRVYLIVKSEHYHAPLGHAFPGYQLIDRARALGIPNATHNNTRGHVTRLLEEVLVRAANGLAREDRDGLNGVLGASDLRVANRVLNLETGSLACEAALKLMLARFYLMEPGAPEPAYEGRTPVFLVMGNDDGGMQANYHGTTLFTQTMRGMWPGMAATMAERGLFRVRALRPNRIEDLEAAFAEDERDGRKIAGFFHEIVMMNYGGRVLTPEYLQRAYALCAEHDVPTLVDEIQSGIWSPERFTFREYGLRPSCVAVGKGFPGGEYPASRLVFSAALDVMPQFGALVTNGQEELASLAYLITMRWAEANSAVIRRVGDYYEERMRAMAAAHPCCAGTSGARHMTTLVFDGVDAAKAFAHTVASAGLDVSAQTYKADCPPCVLTKLPITFDEPMVDFVIDRFEAALKAL